MQFEWDAAKSAEVKATRGASFEELAEAAEHGGFLGLEENPLHPSQRLLIVRFEGEIWAVPIERRGSNVRFVTAYRSRKWRKKYGT